MGSGLCHMLKMSYARILDSKQSCIDTEVNLEGQLEVTLSKKHQQTIYESLFIGLVLMSEKFKV